MRCSYSSYRSAISTDWTFDSNFVYQELQYSFDIDFFLMWIIIGAKQTLLRLSIPAIVPNENITLTSYKKVKPICIWGSDHPLIYQSIGITHYDCWLVHILLVGRFTGFSWHILWLKFDHITLALSCWEEHRIKYRLISTRYRRNQELLSLKILLHYQFSLVKISK